MVDKEDEIASLQSALVSREAQIAELQALLNSRDLQVAGLLNSRSWRLTWFLRVFGHQARRGKHLACFTRDLIKRNGGTTHTVFKALRIIKSNGIHGFVQRWRQSRAVSVVDSSPSLSQLLQPYIRLDDPLLISMRAKNDIRVLFVSGEPHTPGHHYRVEQYMESAKSNGFRVSWIASSDLGGAGSDLACDLAIIWRTRYSSDVDTFISLVRHRGGKVIFDLDDLMILPELATPDVIDAIRSERLSEGAVANFYALIRETMIRSDACIATTHELAFHMHSAGKVAFVLPNGFDQLFHDTTRSALIEWDNKKDALIRIGYAGGSRTHQQDFSLVAGALAAVLSAHPNCRLVLFRLKQSGTPIIDLEEFPILDPVRGQIEWRDFRPLSELGIELARFDINLAPLDYGNAFCEAKSELKYFESALANVPTIASPTGPFIRAIDHRKTGFLASCSQDWRDYIFELIDNEQLRRDVGKAAYHKALSCYGPRIRHLRMGMVLDQLMGGSSGSRSFALSATLSKRKFSPPDIRPSSIVWEKKTGSWSKVAVVIPLYNYQTFVVQALDSVFAQTLEDLELIVVDDCSTDKSLATVIAWAENNARRFNRMLVLRNGENYGLGLARNIGIAATYSSYVLPLDADNILDSDCCRALLFQIEKSVAAYVYPVIRLFGERKGLIGGAPYEAQRLVPGNYIDAMALIAKEAWAAVGGYASDRREWEDYDFWCRIAELGLAGEQCNEVLASYRVHRSSMIQKINTQDEMYRSLMERFTNLHPWVSLSEYAALRGKIAIRGAFSENQRFERLRKILRCPATGLKLLYSDTRDELVSMDGARRWPVVKERPVFTADGSEPTVMPFDHVSNSLPEAALKLIENPTNFVLNLSAGGSFKRYENVIEAEYSIFRNTDVVCDAHELPFDDECFDVVVCLNAFEHYECPTQVVAEIFRVLKRGGQIFVHTAFLQPLHEKPFHYFNCTRYGLSKWFESFKIETINVSDNFGPEYAVSWLLSECEDGLKSEFGAVAAQSYAETRVGELGGMWRNPLRRGGEVWSSLQSLPQERKEAVAAGFELIGRKP